MRVKHHLEQSRLGDLVVLLHALLAAPRLLLRQPLLPAVLPAPDLPQLVVVVVVRHQADVEERDTAGELERGKRARELFGPRRVAGGTVGSQPGADEGSIDDLKAERGEPDNDVNGRHAGLQEGEGDGAVGVMDDEEAGEHLVLPG